MKNLKLLMLIPAALFTFGCSHMHYKGCGCQNDDPPAATSNANQTTTTANEHSHQVLTDSAITTAVKSKLIAKKIFTKEDISAMTVKVETTNGVVNLSGTANNQTQIRHAIRVAKSVRGVKGVNSNITIANQS